MTKIDFKRIGDFMDENLNNNGNVQIPIPENNDSVAQDLQATVTAQTMPISDVAPTAAPEQPQTVPGYQQPQQFTAPQGYPQQPQQPAASQGYQQQPYQQAAPQGYQQQPYQQAAPQGYQQQPYQQATPQGYQQQGFTYQQVGVVPANATPKANKKMLPIIIGAAAAAFVAFVSVIIFILTSLGKTTVDMKKYYAIDVNGFNGYAKASMVTKTVDPYTALKAEGKLKNSSSSYSALSYYAFFNDIDGELSKTQGISNGDTIELTFTYNKELAKQLKIKIKNTTIKLKVSGLAEGTKVDPFDGLEVTFSGVSPNGKVTVSNNSSDSFIRRVSYTVDKKNRLKNGDTIVVTASYDEDFAIENGYAVVATEKEYKVSGLSYYLDDQTTVSATSKAAFEKEFKDRVDSILASRASYIYNQFGEYVIGGGDPIVGTPEMVKGYLLSRKDTESSYSTYNRIVIIYKVDITISAPGYSSSPEKFGKRTGYIAVEFTNAGLENDGNILLSYSTSAYSGYKASATTDTLENDYVTSYKSNYIVTNW